MAVLPALSLVEQTSTHDCTVNCNCSAAFPNNVRWNTLEHCPPISEFPTTPVCTRAAQTSRCTFPLAARCRLSVFQTSFEAKRFGWKK